MLNKIANNTPATSLVEREMISGPQMEPLEITIPMMLSCVIAVVSNIFVCYLILTVRRLKTVTNVFVFSLCLCDVLFAGILLPFHCFYQQSLIYQYLVLITVLIYIANLTAVTYERLYSITKPMRYHQFMTKRRAIQITIASWIIPFIYCLLPFIWGNDTATLAHKIYLIGTLVLFLIGPLIFIMFVYIKVCLEIKRMFDYEKKFIVATGKQQTRRRSSIAATQFFTICCLRCEKGIKESSKGIANTSSAVLRVALSPRHNFDKKENSIEKLNQCGRKFSITDEYTEDSTTSLDDININSVRLEQRSVSFSSATISTRTKKLSTTSSIRGHLSECSNTDSTRQLKEEMLAFIKEQKRSSPSNKTRVSLISQNVKIKTNINKMKNKMTELKASFAFGIVAFTYMFTWLPVAIMTFMVALDKPQYITPSMAIFSIFAIAVNALSDPFLYGILLHPFRTTIKHVFRKMCCPRR